MFASPPVKDGRHTPISQIRSTSICILTIYVAGNDESDVSKCLNNFHDWFSLSLVPTRKLKDSLSNASFHEDSNMSPSSARATKRCVHQSYGRHSLVVDRGRD